MRYFIDTEFIRHGNEVIPVSLAIVKDNEELRQKSNTELLFPTTTVPGIYFEFPLSESDLAKADAFVKNHVLASLNSEKTSLEDARAAILEFIGEDKYPEFIADYGAFDYVVFANIFGSFDNYPKHFPMFFTEFQSLLAASDCGFENYAKLESTHNALDDALEMYRQYRYMRYEEEIVIGRVAKFIKRTLYDVERAQRIAKAAAGLSTVDVMEKIA